MMAETVVGSEAEPGPMTGNSPETVCSDCGVSPGVVRKLRKYFCSPCWIHHCVFRFRKRLFEFGKPAKGASVMFRDASGTFVNSQENVLIYYDGSLGSRALLNLVRKAVVSHSEIPESERQGNLPFPFTFSVLYAYEGVNQAGDEVSSESWKSDIEFLKSWSRDTRERFSVHFPLGVTSLETTLRPASSSFPEQTCGDESSSSSQQLLNWKEIREDEETHLPEHSSSLLPFDLDLNRRLGLLLQSIKSKTSREDFLQCLRQNLIVSVAQAQGLSKVLVPEDQTSMAVKMFSIMSLGRGAQLAEQMSFVTRIDGIDLARPMMDLSTDDLREFLNCLENVKCQNPLDKGKSPRIDNLKSQCEEFIVTLQKDFPSTVPTLTKIGAKLQPSTLIESSQVQKCRLCKRLQDQSEEALCYGCTSIFKETTNKAIFLELIS